MKTLLFTLLLFVICFQSSLCSTSSVVTNGMKSGSDTQSDYWFCKGRSSRTQSITSTIEPGVRANIVDFGRCRISSNIGYAGPYIKDTQGAMAEIVLQNTSTTPVSVQSVVITGSRSAFSIPDVNVFAGLTLQPGSVITRSLSYTPSQAGYDTLRILFTTDANSAEFMAVGVGVIPHITITDVMFSPLSLKGGHPVHTKKWQITNLGLNTTPQWEFGDAATITDFIEPQMTSKIGVGGVTDVGSERFSYDKAMCSLPIKLRVGEQTRAFDAFYQPIIPGFHSALLQTISDAEFEVTSTWNGSASFEMCVEWDIAQAESSTFVADGSELKLLNTLDDSFEIALFNINGICIRQLTSSDLHHATLDVHDISPGIYTLVCRSAHHVSSRVVMKL